MDVKRKLLTGSFWIALSEVLKAIAELSSSIVAARVLDPADIGLMGVVMLTVAILEWFSVTGFDQALVQKQKDVTPFLNVAWTWHVLRGAGLAVILAIAAPFVAEFYAQPALKYLIWVSTAHMIMNGLQNIGVVFFSRDLDFKTICLVNALRAFAHAGIAIPAVVIRQDVWGLMIGLVAATAVNLAVSYIVHPYRPKFEWNTDRFKELFSYGRWITGLSFILFIITQGDDIFVSKYLGVTALAFYQLAYNLSNLPATKITHVISRVSFPAYSRLQHDPEQLRESFIGVMRTTVLMSAPLAVGIWLVVPGIVEHIIGAKWQPIIPLVQILVISAFIRSIAALAGALFQACDRPDLDFKMNLPRFFAVVGLIWPFTAWWGLEGACWVVVIAIATTMPVFFYGVHKLVRLTLVDVLRVNAMAAVCASLLAAAFFGVEATGASSLIGGLPGFVIQVLGALSAWAVAMWILGKFTPMNIFAEIRTLIGR